MKPANQINQQLVMTLALNFFLILVACSALFSTHSVIENVDNAGIFSLMNAHDLEYADQMMMPQEPAAAIVKLTKYPLKAGHGGQVHSVLEKYVLTALKQKDNLMAEAYYERENPDILWLIERWKSKNSYDHSRSTEAFRNLTAIIPEHLQDSVEMSTYRDLEPLSQSAWRKQPNDTDKSFTVMLFVDALAGTQDEFISRYHVAMPKFRTEKGVVTYGLSQNIDDQTKFITYEKFRNEEAFQFHLKFEPVKPVLDFLEHSIKKPPFQNGIHNLILFSPKIN